MWISEKAMFGIERILVKRLCSLWRVITVVSFTFKFNEYIQQK